MRLSLLFLLTLFSMQALAADQTIAERVDAATAAAATPAGKAFQAQLQEHVYPLLGTMMTKCSQTSGLPVQDFTLVAQVTVFQTITDPQVSPDNAFTRCVIPRFVSQCFPLPPLAEGQRSYPLTVQFTADMASHVLTRKQEKAYRLGSCGF